VEQGDRGPRRKRFKLYPLQQGPDREYREDWVREGGWSNSSRTATRRSSRSLKLRGLRAAKGIKGGPTSGRAADCALADRLRRHGLWGDLGQRVDWKKTFINLHCTHQLDDREREEKKSMNLRTLKGESRKSVDSWSLGRPLEASAMVKT